MKFTTPVLTESQGIRLSLNDSIMVLGSCFADEIGSRLTAAGFNVCVNPFGTLYNPESMASAVRRLDSGEPFTVADCVEMGAGAGLVCSFSHHTSFARSTESEFLANANGALAQASAFWHRCNKVIVTLGTAMVWRHNGMTVSNCLKRPACEFTHEMLTFNEIESALGAIVHPGKEYVFTVSPIRHLSQGAHVNTVSKARLQVVLDGFMQDREECCYFPAYEILMDELRDYRFYADDLCHPSNMAVEYIWEKFVDSVVSVADHERLKENEKQSRHARHISMRRLG